jgi:hypothetical protein
MIHLNIATQNINNTNKLTIDATKIKNVSNVEGVPLWQSWSEAPVRRVS